VLGGDEGRARQAAPGATGTKPSPSP
jgi:hypothetical protein